jgi:thiamine biosynthesis protein ThiS
MRGVTECQTNPLQSPETNLIEIVVNGETRRPPAGLTILELLGWLDIDRSRVAVELNRNIIRQADWSVTRVEAGAQLEIVQFVGGG